MVRLKASEHRRPRGWQYTLHSAGYSTLKVGERARQLRGASGYDDSAQDGQRVPQYTACKIGRSTHLAWLLVSGRSFGAPGRTASKTWLPEVSSRRRTSRQAGSTAASSARRGGGLKARPDERCTRGGGVAGKSFAGATSRLILGSRVSGDKCVVPLD